MSVHEHSATQSAQPLRAGGGLLPSTPPHHKPTGGGGGGYHAHGSIHEYHTHTHLKSKLFTLVLVMFVQVIAPCHYCSLCTNLLGAVARCA